MRHVLYGFLFISFLIAGCSQGEKKNEMEAKPASETQQSSALSKKQSVEFTFAEFTEKAWLRNSLPDSADIYLRIPTPWFLFTGVDNSFKFAQKNEHHVHLLQAIQQGLRERLSTQFDATTGSLVSLLSTHMISPLEIAALPNTSDPATPTIIFATKLDFATTKEFHKTISPLLSFDTTIQEIDPMAPNGMGTLAIPLLNNTSVYQFNPSTSELLVVSSNILDKESLKGILAAIKPAPSHPMHTVERSIDASSKGIFGFINVKNLLPMLATQIPPEAQMGLQMSGLDQINFLAFGYGAGDGKTRLKIVADMPNAGFRTFLPIVNNTFDFHARGSIDTLGVLALPTESQFKQLEHLLVFSGQSSPEYAKFLEEFKRQTGFAIEQVFTIIGPEVVLLSDEVNDFLAIRLQDSEKFHQFLSNAAEKGWLQFNEITLKNITINHAAVPFSTSAGLDELRTALTDNVAQDKNSAALFDIFGKINSHYYWLEEDGFLILANIPQPLVERSLRDDKVNINTWLTSTQKHDMSNALVAFTTSKSDISRNYYYHYLQILQLLSDISGTEGDFQTLPHAGELKFSEKGSVAVSLNSSENQLALECSFEESILDLFYTIGGTYETAAMVGILSAIAIPQFAEYREKAQMQSTLLAAKAAQGVVEDLLNEGITLDEIRNGQHSILPPMDVVDKNVASIDIKLGTVIIELKKAPKSNTAGATLTYTPSVDETTGAVIWECTSAGIIDRYLPPTCQNLD